MSALGHTLTNTLAPKLQRLWPGCLTLGVICLGWLLAYDGKRIFQIGVLALPAVLCWCWPSRHACWRAMQVGFVGTMGLVFITDAAVRGFLLDVYEASPASTMVITAVANTTPQEMIEFMAMNGLSMWLWGLFAFFSLSFLMVSLAQWHRSPSPSPPQKMKGWRLGAMLLVLTVIVVSVLNKPWRQHHPLIFWTHWVTEVSSLRDQWDTLDEQRQRLLANAQTQNPRVTAGAPDTLVLVISESVNRGHLSLYGYPRNTTPALQLLEKNEGDRLGVFAHAWSVDASTVQALRNFFYFGHVQDQQHLMALAAKAGYETWWISNHDDLAIDQEHAKLADRVHMLNKTPGRSGVSLDEATLPHLAAALKSQAARKLIVVHLLGIHPHYALRRPVTHTPFNNVKDDIYQTLKDQGRSARVRDLRNDYDSAIHYHDEVVAATLDMTRTLVKNASWVYFSDHGQEVGHVGNHVGHSAATADGYRVPLLVWGVGIENFPSATFTQPLRTDWLGHSVMFLLGIDWMGHLPEKNVFDIRYRWQAPPLPMVADFAS